MPAPRYRILHAIHDFLPQCQAGSELYTNDLCRTLADRGHHVTVVCATFDPSLPHGHVRWRIHDGLPVAEVVNNWVCHSFDDSYRSPVMANRLDSVLQAVQPDIVHVHNLLNLTFDLPRLARNRGAHVVATLHDYTLVCPAGGQRVHRAESHLCQTIDTVRCARCFAESPFGTRTAWGRVSGGALWAAPLMLAGRAVRAVAPRTTMKLASRLPTVPATPADIDRRMEAARALFDDVDLFVAPSRSIAREFIALGLPPRKVHVSDYGFARPAVVARREPSTRLRIGFVGTLVWHKGVHVLIDAVRRLRPDAFSLTVIGDLDVFPDYTADLKQRSEGLPVVFTGVRSRNEVFDAFAHVDVLVVPSLWLENSPLVIHEAFLAGVPVVGSRIGGIPDLVTHELNGLLVEAGNSGALADALRRLVSDPTLLASLTPSSTSVKRLEDDATEWERTYHALVETPATLAALS